MKISLISTSLNPKSQSRELLESCKKQLSAQASSQASFQWIDLQEYNLPLCATNETSSPDIEKIKTLIKDSDAFLFSTPVYNFLPSASFKNFLELFGGELKKTPVALVASAGSSRSYSSLMPTLNALMLDFECPVIPQIVMQSRKDPSPEVDIQKRIMNLCSEIIRWANLFKK